MTCTGCLVRDTVSTLFEMSLSNSITPIQTLNTSANSRLSRQRMRWLLEMILHQVVFHGVWQWHSPSQTSQHFTRLRFEQWSTGNNHNPLHLAKTGDHHRFCISGVIIEDLLSKDVGEHTTALMANIVTARHFIHGMYC